MLLKRVVTPPPRGGTGTMSGIGHQSTGAIEFLADVSSSLPDALRGPLGLTGTAGGCGTALRRLFDTSMAG